MTRVQVRSLLGTPMVADPFESCALGLRLLPEEGRLSKPQQRHFIVFFDESDKVTRIERRPKRHRLAEPSASAPIARPDLNADPCAGASLRARRAWRRLSFGSISSGRRISMRSPCAHARASGERRARRSRRSAARVAISGKRCEQPGLLDGVRDRSLPPAATAPRSPAARAARRRPTRGRIRQSPPIDRPRALDERVDQLAAVLLEAARQQQRRASGSRTRSGSTDSTFAPRSAMGSNVQRPSSVRNGPSTSVQL